MSENTLDSAIDALVEKRIEKRLDSYNAHILHELKRADDVPSEKFKGDLRQWFIDDVMEKE